jgi:hypothetical protein
MPFSGLLRRVALVRTKVSDHRINSIIRLQRIVVPRTVLQFLVIAYVVLSSLILSIPTLIVIRSSETSFLTKAILRHIPEGGILHSPAVKTSNLLFLFFIVVYKCLNFGPFSDNLLETVF